MRRFISQGDVPRKRHMQVTRNGKLVYEELFGREGFSGPSALLYHINIPEGATDISAAGDDSPEMEKEGAHVHAHLETFRLAPHGDLLRGRQWLLVNQDVRIGLAAPTSNHDGFYVNASADEVYYFHHGTGTFNSQFGRLSLREGDYLVIPKGTVYSLELDNPQESRLLVVEALSGMVDSPQRYRAQRTGQLLEAAPYSERDIRTPELQPPQNGPATLLMKREMRFSAYQLDHHPLDVLGWDGTVYPCAFSIHDFEPRAGRFHVPPPTHQTFEAPGFVLCSFAPRKLDWDPQAIFLPYHHSNVDSDEVIYYAGGTYAARRGISEGSITHHVGGFPHGPQPGAVEASLDKPRETDEVAVMVDTFRPLHRTETARQVLDPHYPFSWQTPAKEAD